MYFIEAVLRGKQIADVLVDSEVTYVMLTDGTQITFRGLLVVEPAASNVQITDI
jgi:hypothetical protein